MATHHATRSSSDGPGLIFLSQLYAPSPSALPPSKLTAAILLEPPPADHSESRAGSGAAQDGAQVPFVGPAAAPALRPTTHFESVAGGGDAQDAVKVPLVLAEHWNGTCRPCHFYNSRTGCVKGDQCSFCHVKHSKRLKRGLVKAERDRCRALAKAIYQAEPGKTSFDAQREIVHRWLPPKTDRDHELVGYVTSVLWGLRHGMSMR